MTQETRPLMSADGSTTFCKEPTINVAWITVPTAIIVCMIGFSNLSEWNYQACCNQ